MHCYAFHHVPKNHEIQMYGEKRSQENDIRDRRDRTVVDLY